MKKEYVIDPEFSRLTIPSTPEQQKELEKSLMEEGCKEPICVWNDIIIDGHKRYSFCSFEEIDFDVKRMVFPSRDHAISWVCQKRLNDAPQGSIMHKYLTGKWYRSLRPLYNDMIRAGIITDIPLDTRGRVRTSKAMARDIGVGYSAIENGEAYSRNMDKVASIAPDIFSAIISGEIKASINEIRLLAHNNQRTKSALRNKLFPDLDIRKQENVSKQKEEKIIELATGIKEMPAFDPDMEISGLALTIPTWMAAIARAERKTDMSLATDYAKKQLAGNLHRLESQIHKTLEALECTDKDF